MRVVIDTNALAMTSESVMPHDALGRYRELERFLWFIRFEGKDESVEEDVVLDEMDAVWARLTVEQRAALDAEASRCWPF